MKNVHGVYAWKEDSVSIFPDDLKPRTPWSKGDSRLYFCPQRENFRKAQEKLKDSHVKSLRLIRSNWKKETLPSIKWQDWHQSELVFLKDSRGAYKEDTISHLIPVETIRKIIFDFEDMKLKTLKDKISFYSWCLENRGKYKERASGEGTKDGL